MNPGISLVPPTTDVYVSPVKLNTNSRKIYKCQMDNDTAGGESNVKLQLCDRSAMFAKMKVQSADYK